MTGMLPQGTRAWFDMAGAEIAKAASRLRLPPELRLSVIERYVDGAELNDGLFQGLRIDVISGAFACRTGVRADEKADVVIEVTASMARRLNLLRNDDPGYVRTMGDAVSSGALRVDGDLGPLRAVLDMAHDSIVDRTM